ncbi:MAG: tetratricopeptide repeat protein [bacterium]|nr:tetratricopeptide repeat protein [bacterium]
MRARVSKASVALVLATALIASSAKAAPDPEQDPVELIRQGRHLDAADAFERLYERTSDPALLFAKATALRRGGDCRGAIEALQRFIATDPPEPDVDAAREVIDVCTEILADDEPEPAPPPPILPQPDVAPEPVPDTANPPSNAWTRDAPGGVLLGSGVVVAIGGAVVLGIGAARTRDREESEAGFERREQSVRTLGAVGGSMVAAGAALLIGSIVRYAVVARRSNRRSTASVRPR